MAISRLLDCGWFTPPPAMSLRELGRLAASPARWNRPADLRWPAPFVPWPGVVAFRATARWQRGLSRSLLRERFARKRLCYMSLAAPRRLRGSRPTRLFQEGKHRKANR